MTRGENLQKKAKCKHRQCSPMTESVFCDLTSGGSFFKWCDKCSNSECKCQKQVTLSRSQYQI